MAFVSKFTGPEIDRRLAQGTYDDAVAAGFTGTKEQFDAWIAAYTPQEMEKLNNKQDKEDPMLETENKTVVGAINLLNSEKQDKEDERLATESKIVVDAINELNTRTTDLYYNKQDKEDSSLATEQKTVVGAINELKLKLQEQDSQKQDKVDDGFATNDKSVVGAVNEVHNELDAHVADYNKHVDEYEAFKADAENTLNSHSTQIGQLTQEKQDKTDFNLATESKTVVNAINENYAAINAEVARAVAEDARLEEVKVSYTDISDSSNPDRKTIMLKNHDSLSGYGTDGTTAYNLAMVSKWDKADFGAAGIPINLNGSEAHPTYNDKEELAFVSELSGETGKLAEDIKTLNETVATVKQDLADNVSSINKNMEDGFNTINDDIDNEIRPAIEKNAKDIGVVNETLTADINHLKPRVTTLEGLQIVKVDSDSETYSASYELQDATGKVYGQRINIATDKFIKSVSYANQVLTIVFVLEDGSEYSQNIDVSELMNVYTAGGGITISETGVVSISDDTLQMIQYSDSEVRRLEKDKIPYAYDEKTQSNINVILPEGGSYLGNYGDENATVAKAAVYDGIKQLELGSSKVHTNINTDSDVTIETPTGKKTIATTDELVNVVNIPIRSLQDKVYTQEEIFDWFGVTSVPELKQKISRGSQMYLRYGILLSGNPMYYKMPIEYTAFESANQIKLVFVGLNTRDDVASKYEILINLDGTIIEGNSNIQVSITSIEPEDIDLSGYATKEELNDYALKSELPDTSNFATKDEIPSLDGYVTETALNEKGYLTSIPEEYVTETELNDKGYLTSVPEEYITESELTAKNYATKSEIPEFATVATSGDYNDLTNIPDLSVYQTKSDDSLTTSVKTISGAINEIKNSVDSISDPYEINLTNLLSAEDSESISTAIGGIDNLNATVQDNRIIVGTISNGSVSVSIRILGNVTTLYYLLDSVLGLTLNEVAITNTSGTLSKSVTTHSVLTENMVINSLNSDETTLPLSAAQGKALNSKIDNIDISADITNAINALDSSGQIASTGEVISSVSQENGVISVSKKTLVSDDIPELPQSKITDLDTALAAKADVSALTEHTSNTSNPHSVTKEQVGLGNVDNTSDTDKPISTAVQEALNLKQDKTDSTLETTDKTIVGAINEILPKATGVGKVDPKSNGSGEVFNAYKGGFSNVASGTYSHAEGGSTTASGYASHSEGYDTTASGDYSHAEGKETKAESNYSHAEGQLTNATGDTSHAEGGSTNAEGTYSHAEGYHTTASGNYSHAEGYYTQTFSSDEHAEGSYNKSYASISAPARVIHSVGIGSSGDRKNAHEIKFNGDHYIYGLGNFDGTNSADSQTLQEVINSKQAAITAGTGLEFEGNTLNVTLDTTVFKVVSALPDSPAQGDENKIHLVPAESTGANNAYTEYVWVNSAWKILGEYTSEVDLTPYLKTADAANTYLSKTDATSTYLNKTDAASTYLNKTDASSTYLNKTDAASTYQPIGDYATSTELTEGLAGKQDAGSYATTTQLEALQTEVNSKADSTALPTYTTVPTLTADYNIPANATTVEKVYDITVGATLYNITYADGIKWVNDVAPITRANHRYVVSIINNLGVWGEF